MWKTVKGRTAQVSNIKQFYEVAQAKCQDIKVLLVFKDEVDANVEFLNKCWEDVAEIKGIRSMHHFRVYDEVHILISRYSGCLMEKIGIKTPMVKKSHVKKRKI